MDERELNGMKDEMEKLAEHLENLGDELDTEVVASMLRLLVHGHTAAAIIEEYGLIHGV
jgi:hypothetical protein